MDIADLPDEPEHLRNIRETLERLAKPMKAFEQLQRPLRQWEEMQRQLGPLRELDELQRNLAPIRQWEEIERRLASHRQLEEIQRRLAPAGQWEEMQKLADLHAQRMMFQNLPDLRIGLHQNALLDALKGAKIASAAASLVPGMERLSQHREWFDRLQRQATGGLLISELTQHLERANPTLSSLAEAQRILDGVRASFEGRDHSVLEFDDEDAQQAENAAKYIAETATSEPTLNATFVQIASHIQAQTNESVQLVLWAYFKKIVEFTVNAVINAVIAFVITQQMQAASTQSTPQATKTVKEAARAAVGSAELLSEHRFVSAKSLKVRLNPNARSPKLAELRFGTAVKLLRRERDFALVVWSDTETGAEIQGWVFARYLQKFY